MTEGIAGAAGNQFLEAALWYARLGWAVFPVHSINNAGACTCGGVPKCKPGKHPLTLHGFKDATTNEDTIRGWWHQWPDSNVGIATGAVSGIFVLDIDNKNDGMAKLNELEAQQDDLPLTLTARTGNGYHQYFRHPGHEVKSRSALAGLAGLDIKGDGGYVVAPPSRHLSGNHYLWEQPPDKREAAPAPDWLLGMIESSDSAPRASDDVTVGERIPEGQRNDFLFRLACSLDAKGLSKAAIAAALRAENAERCDPPLGDDELAAILNSAAKYSDSANTANYANRADVPWDLPIPLQEFDVPPFPTECLPSAIRNFVEAEATATQTPADLAAMMSLSVMAAACAGKFMIEVRPGWREPLNLFTVTALPSASRKSTVFTDVTAPLEDFEREEVARLAPEVRADQTRYDIAEKALKRAEEKAAKAGPDSMDALRAEAERRARDLSVMHRPVAPRYIVKDVTPEKLSNLLHDHHGRMALMSAEGGVFDLMGGRYSQDGRPNFEVYLNGHAGDSLRVDRMGRETEFVKRPALTLGLAVQPAVLEGLARKREFCGRGLLARFLYSVPKSLVGLRDVDPPSVPQDVQQVFDHAIRALIALPVARDEQGDDLLRILTLNSDTYQQLLQFAAEIESRLGAFGDLEPISNWGGKLVGATARIAGLIHLTENIDSPMRIPVAATTIDAAIQIARYLIPHARAAFAQMGADPAVEDAKHVLRWIRHKKVAEFTKRDLFEGTKGRFKTVAALEPALRLLMDHAYLRERPAGDRLGPGRPASPIYDVNPAYVSQYSHNSQNRVTRPSSEDSANTATQASDPTIATHDSDAPGGEAA